MLRKCPFLFLTSGLSCPPPTTTPLMCVPPPHCQAKEQPCSSVMVLSIWNSLSLIPGYSHPTGSKRPQKAKYVGRNQIEKNYFLIIPAISGCPHKNGQAANSRLQAREPHLDSMFSRAKWSIQALLNLVSWPGRCKCLTTLWLGGESKQSWTHSVMA